MTRRVDAYDQIRREVVARLDRAGMRPDGDLPGLRAEVRRVVDDYQRRARLGDGLILAEPDELLERVVRAVADWGPITELIAAPDVEEIFIEGARISYLDGAGHLRGLAVPTTEVENRALVERLLSGSDRSLSVRNPLVQARVLDGTARLTAAIPPVADRLSATLRRYTVRRAALDDLVARGTLSPGAAAFCWALMQVRSRIAVSGEPGAGKTTFLAALLAAVPPGHCVRSCEEIRELAVPLTHGGYYEVRPPGPDDTGELTLRHLVKFVLGMRPDRIVVGEVRGAEAFELTRAINAGCGFCATVHANGAEEALPALVHAALMAGEHVTEPVVRSVLASALDVVVHVERDESGPRPVRRVREIVGVAPSLSEGFTCEPIFVRSRSRAELEWTGALSQSLAERIGRALPDGTTLRDLIETGEVPA